MTFPISSGKSSNPEAGHRFWWVDSPQAGVRLAITSRFGGHSGGQFQSQNLGLHVGDDPETVLRNRAEVCRELGVEPTRLRIANQVHGVEVVDPARQWPKVGVPDADAVITATGGFGVGVLVADCVPVLVWSPQRVVGAIHAGRAGMAAGVVGRALTEMADLGAQTVHVVVGPAICGLCYEVPEAMRTEISKRHPATAAKTRAGTPALDVSAGVLAQLQEADLPVRVESVQHIADCTMETPGLFSYRRDQGHTGRFAAIAVLTESGE